MKRITGLFLSALVFAGALAGCGGGESSSAGSGGEKAASPPETVTLKLYPGQMITSEDMELMVNGPLRKKYPHLSVEVIDRTNNSLENQVATGGQLDLITTWNGSMSANMNLGIFEDIEPLAKKQGLDLGRFDPQALETIREIADDKKLYGLPYNVQFNALYYNKDIFDKFAVSYPKDGMFWEDAIELAKKLSREADGVAYRGLDPDTISRMSFPLSLEIVDARTNKVLINSEPYRKLFEMGYKVYTIPGNKPAKWSVSSYDAFIKDKTVAMSAHVNLFPYIAQVPEFNWDIAQYPSYKERPNVYGMYDLHIMSVSKTSKYKDETIKVLEVLFSDETQMIATRRTGRVSPLKDPKFQQAYGADMPILKGKHLEAIFKSKPAPAPRLSTHYSKASSIMRTHFQNYVDGKTDLNTALRSAEEEIVKYIQAQTGN